MRAVRIHEFDGIDTMRLDEIPRPVPGAGEVLVAVKAAGVGPWDRLAREGRSGLGQALPLTLGSDVSGSVVALGAGGDADLSIQDLLRVRRVLPTEKSGGPLGSLN
jgi:NADPH:quinone reductase-like Zn-dependent oxidoreductase